ncbi:glycosyl transferase [Thecamonas trahens ATCC 50062]|uniref:GDP-Man:Man(3)GlcNAc(2)-PP-Dol alpha-1,2-mannosyltransferase n=1 Tax=Thecamonas trahens ATCC 50062 TaxID=461836 RepID=A0A0L0DFI1_THETB|nr:glycosyl transferase [Thecamonas trahens ATCC 50062]KNC51054.1 glycosyl transferase [Thecamonas trahens ATCC 50062]|eukprot:XP_013756516.1 glycosyl transferase [Thecamonas trahens ATCC 50062]
MYILLVSLVWWTYNTVLVILGMVVVCKVVATLTSPATHTIAFFHPYANAGGGGERVLWKGVAAAMARWPSARILIYTGNEGIPPEDILARARNRFAVELPREPIFVFLATRTAVESHALLRPTMLMQSLGSMVLAGEALFRARAHVVIDSMGYAFTYPVFSWIGGAVVGAYVHYPTISTDMLAAVVAQRPSYNNSSLVASSVTLSSAKATYYRAFAWLYGFMGRRATMVTVNSSWTHGHIAALWGMTSPALRTVFPPCDCATFLELPPPDAPSRSLDIVSVGQFRPEKDHLLQVRAFARARATPGFPAQAKLVLIGSVRNADDAARVAALHSLAAELDVADAVDIRTDVAFPDLVAALGASTVGLHTMWNEHFGIAVVEYMAAGLVTLAHGTGGPLMDIVGPPSAGRGFLATSLDEFADQLVYIYAHLPEARAVAAAGRASVMRFSDDVFDAAFTDALALLEPVSAPSP